MLKGKKIIVGITGSIAAYKVPVLVRLLIKEGAEVKVVMSKAAADFVTPLTLSTVSKNPVGIEFSDPKSGEWVNHVELGLWADLFIIAPLSANTMARMANGFCDNLLMAVYLSAKCPVIVAPAMDLDMWKHPTTASNLEKIKSHGVRVIMPAHGELASGLTGEGRMEEPEVLFSQVKDYFVTHLPLKDKKVLVTAGPTYEKIDAVRFIGNRSSGKMGFALAESFASQGADVTLVSGPVALTQKNSSIHRLDVENAEEMFRECMDIFEDQDIIVMNAAVADYAPMQASEIKMKKENNTLNIALAPTRDILAEMGKRKKKNQVLVGFALETDNELENSKKKLAQKNLDLIVLNSLKDEGAGFVHDTNKVTIIGKNGEEVPFGLMPKELVAREIVNYIISQTK